MRRFFYPDLARYYPRSSPQASSLSSPQSSPNDSPNNSREAEALSPVQPDAAPPGEVVLSDIVIELDKPESHHAKRVVRLSVSDEVTLFDGQGVVAVGEIVRMESRVLVKLKRATRSLRTGPWVDIATALPKGSRADEMLSQLSQLGVDRTVPLISKWSVVNPRESKLDRLRKAAIESAKQCGRSFLMEIGEVAHVDKLIAQSDHDLKLIASTSDDVLTSEEIQHALAQVGSEGGRVLVMIGPEGGWTEPELAAAKAAGFVAWSLGSLVMRIETAATAAGTLVRYLTK